MHSPQDFLQLAQQDKAVLSAYLNGATFSVDDRGRERFHPRIDRNADNLKVIYVGNPGTFGTVNLEVSIGQQDGRGNYDLTDFGLDLVCYEQNHRVGGELTTRNIRVFHGLKMGATYTIVPHGEDGGSEVLDPVRRHPPSAPFAEPSPLPEISEAERAAVRGEEGALVRR